MFRVTRGHQVLGTFSAKPLQDPPDPKPELQVKPTLRPPRSLSSSSCSTPVTRKVTDRMFPTPSTIGLSRASSRSSSPTPTHRNRMAASQAQTETLSASSIPLDPSNPPKKSRSLVIPAPSSAPLKPALVQNMQNPTNTLPSPAPLFDLGKFMKEFIGPKAVASLARPMNTIPSAPQPVALQLAVPNKPPSLAPTLTAIKEEEHQPIETFLEALVATPPRKIPRILTRPIHVLEAQPIHAAMAKRQSIDRSTLSTVSTSRSSTAFAPPSSRTLPPLSVCSHDLSRISLTSLSSISHSSRPTLKPSMKECLGKSMPPVRPTNQRPALVSAVLKSLKADLWQTETAEQRLEKFRRGEKLRSLKTVSAFPAPLTGDL